MLEYFTQCSSETENSIEESKNCQLSGYLISGLNTQLWQSVFHTNTPHIPTASFQKSKPSCLLGHFLLVMKVNVNDHQEQQQQSYSLRLRMPDYVYVLCQVLKGPGRVERRKGGKETHPGHPGTGWIHFTIPHPHSHRDCSSPVGTGLLVIALTHPWWQLSSRER